MTAEQQEKARFFAQYYGQHILRSSLWASSIKSCKLYPEVIGDDDKYKFYLLLTPLSMITDEDRDITSNLSFKESDIPQAIDYLRSKGYSVPWMGISVEEQVQRGWIKLKS
jgi:hypothetical protein